MVVVVAVALVEGVTPDVLPAVPEAPIELVLPEVSLPGVAGVVPPLAVALPEPVVPLVLLVSVEPLVPAVPLVAGAVVLLLEVAESVLGGVAGVVVVDELEDDVVGTGVVSSRLVQAPSETAAMSASAAHEVRDAFIGETPCGGCSKSSSEGGRNRLTAL